MNRMLYITIITYIISILRQVVALIILVERISYFQILIFRLSGNFWLVSFKISYLCLPLFHETRTTPSCHPSGCAYRQL